MSKILIFLNNIQKPEASWVILNEAGHIQKSRHQGDLHELTSFAQDSEFIVIIPAQDVLLTHAKLPKLGRQRLRQALPYALEEQLLSDITEMHFAIGEYKENEPLPVAIIAKQKMEAWLAMLKQAGLSPTVMTTMTFALPANDHHWHITLHDNIVIARTGLYSGFSGDIDNLDHLINLKLAEEKEKPQRIFVNYYGDEKPTAFKGDSSAFEKKEQGMILIEKKTLPETQFIADLRAITTNPFINLLQPPYQAKRKTLQSKKVWLAAGYLALATIGLVFLSHLVSFFILHHQASALDASIDAIYKRNFPQATAVVAPKQRITDKLNNLTNQGSHNRVLAWLTYIAKSPQKNAVHIQQIDYANNQLTLELSAPNFDGIDTFTQSLSQQGLQVKQQNIAASGAQVKGSLLITEDNNA
jgi:general secretion pathway protein L